MYKRIETNIGHSLCDDCDNYDTEEGCFFDRRGFWKEGRDECPDVSTPVQIEISPADAPTREELIEALWEYVDSDEFSQGDGNGGIGGDVQYNAEALLSRCKEADHE